MFFFIGLLFSCTEQKAEQVFSPPKIRIEDRDPHLTELSQQAIALAPKWLQPDLSVNLSVLDDGLQNELALLMIDNDDPWMLDEIGFSIAHLSPEVLTHEDFYPQLIAENAQLIYSRDDVLNYVEIIDNGVPGDDPNYYTTTRYQIEDENGNRTEKTINKEMYYWYLVHPRMEDELPFYIDAWAECGNEVSGFQSECPATPEDGTFWRHFLWEGAVDQCPEERECPIVKDYVTTEEVMWKSKAYDRSDNGAIGAIINWQIDAMSFGAGNERPIQPNRIYAVGCGNCGEWSDMATAAARSALIPSQNVGARGNDHVWNEFWDEDWMQWEPVNTYVLHWYYYRSAEGETSQSNPLYAITASRGDGYVSTERTVDYANTFELEVLVNDENGFPVDGAVVTLFGPIVVYDVDGYWYIGEGYTGADGIARFVLGESNEYLFRVDSPIGANPEETNLITPFLSNTVAGENHSFEVILNTSKSILQIEEVPVTIENDETITLTLDLHHRLSADGYMLRGSMMEAVEQGHIHAFVVDSDNYWKYKDGEAVEAHAIHRNVNSGEFSFQLSSEERWYLILSNQDSTAISTAGGLELTLSSDTMEWEDVSLEETFVLQPGEDIAIQITQAP